MTDTNRGAGCAVTLLLVFSLWGAPGWAQSPVPDCSPKAGIESICGLSAPEDIVEAPDGRHLVFGQMAAPGGLFTLDTRDHSTRALYTAGGTGDAPGDGGPPWGDPACSEAPATLLAHGIDLRRRADGRWQLLVVNHGGRESVEFFELAGGPQGLEAAWRGCAEAPEDASLNDVVGLPGGGFLVTRMTSRDAPLWEMLLAVVGIDNGVVYRWDPDSGYRELPGTEGRFPNGIALAPGGDSFYVNMYLGSSVRHYSLPEASLPETSLPKAELLGEVAVSRPDNLSWTGEGHLLVASHHASLWQLMGSLRQDHRVPSLLPYSIVEIDPQTLATRELFHHEGEPMGAGTVAVQRDDALYIGSYVGDRIVRVPLAAER